MKKVYLDNAATTSIREEVINEITMVLRQEFGNPSSTHGFGRSAKAIIEQARKDIAKNINAQSSEILFTSSATEATNWILRSAVRDHGVKTIITSKVEHHATLYTVLALQKEFNINVEYINVNPNGSLDYKQLEAVLSRTSAALVTLMHVNNETGVIHNIQQIGALCQQYNALFHCDTVQSVGKLPLDVASLPVDFIVASAHKFHGPKGIGFAYIKKGFVLQPILFGGEQEKGWRAGTEAVHQIAGMAKALSLAYANLQEEQAQIEGLKQYCITQLTQAFPALIINGQETLYNIVNVTLPFNESKTAMILFHLDMKGIAVSRGSACQSGSQKPSHVLAEMLTGEALKLPSLRISFSHYNAKEDIDILIECLKAV
jgi:cysteine desulfurase